MSAVLREAREKKGHTVEEVSEILKIRKQYIISLEEENYENLPGEIYVKGYSRIYHEFLGLELPETYDDTARIDDLKNDNININDKKTNKTVTVVICTVLFILVMTSYYIFQNYDFSQNNFISNGIIYEDGDNDEAELDQSY